MASQGMGQLGPTNMVQVHVHVLHQEQLQPCGRPGHPGLTPPDEQLVTEGEVVSTGGKIHPQVRWRHPSQQEMLEHQVLGRAAYTPAVNVARTAFAVPVGGRYRVQAGAAKVEGHIAMVANHQLRLLGYGTITCHTRGILQQ